MCRGQLRSGLCAAIFLTTRFIIRALLFDTPLQYGPTGEGPYSVGRYDRRSVGPAQLVESCKGSHQRRSDWCELRNRYDRAFSVRVVIRVGWLVFAPMVVMIVCVQAPDP